MGEQKMERIAGIPGASRSGWMSPRHLEFSNSELEQGSASGDLCPFEH